MQFRSYIMKFRSFVLYTQYCIIKSAYIFEFVIFSLLETVLTTMYFHLLDVEKWVKFQKEFKMCAQCCKKNSVMALTLSASTEEIFCSSACLVEFLDNNNVYLASRRSNKRFIPSLSKAYHMHSS
jgi:hypothetical protein